MSLLTGDADLKMAEDICFNAKVQRPGTCNAMETMLVDKKNCKGISACVWQRGFKKAGVTLKGCPGNKKNPDFNREGKRGRFL